MHIADRESNFIPSAVSASGTYLGVYQIGRYHVPAWPNALMQGPWWKRWFPNLYPFTDPNILLNGRFNVFLAIRNAHFGGWAPWSM